MFTKLTKIIYLIKLIFITNVKSVRLLSAGVNLNNIIDLSSVSKITTGEQILGNEYLNIDYNNYEVPIPDKTYELGRQINAAAANPENHLNLLDGYGCWCNFNNWNNTGGEPKDYIDLKCKELFESYQCYKQRSLSENKECNPEEVNYESGLLHMHLTSAIMHKVFGNEIPAVRSFLRMQTSCERLNRGNQCAIDACKIETLFLYRVSPNMYMSVIDGFEDGYNPKFSRKNGFNFEKSCLPKVWDPIQFTDMDRNYIFNFNDDKIDGGNGNGLRQMNMPTKEPPVAEVNMVCCGQVPFEFQWNSARNEVECCNSASTLFNPITQCCLDSGSVVVCGEIVGRAPRYNVQMQLFKDRL